MKQALVLCFVFWGSGSLWAQPDGQEALFGDLHVHTSYSMDAYLFGTIADPAQAYQFARGEKIDTTGDGTPDYQLETPLDFLAVTDHAEWFAEMEMTRNPSNENHDLAFARVIRLARALAVGDPDQGIASDRSLADSVFPYMGSPFAMLYPPQRLGWPNDTTYQKTAWDRLVQAANDADAPGEFTALVAFEWTGMPSGNNLHRNVIFEGGAPDDAPWSVFECKDPEELWVKLEASRSAGFDVLAIPHNPNISGGLMYQRSKGADVVAMDQAYVEMRARNEPLVEIFQTKGNSETHTALSTDEFAEFESLPLSYGLGGTVTAAVVSKYDFVREGLKLGLEHEQTFGVNPFKQGIIASTDTHNGTAATAEHNWRGHHGVQDNTRQRRLTEGSVIKNPGGLAGVWVGEGQNNRAAIFAALKNKTTFGTSGNRIKVHFSGKFAADTETTVMGGSLIQNTGAPQFEVWAMRDPSPFAHDLDRIQIIKGWFDGTESHERIYNLKSGPAGEMNVSWSDPAFDSSQRAFYYARVLEVPSPRWSSYDAANEAVDRPKDTIRERAWSSPIWYSPTQVQNKKKKRR